MSREIHIYCKNLGRYIDVPPGATLMETAAALGSELGIDPICAIVNNKTEDLSYTVYGPKQVEFLDYTVKQGRDVYVRSLCMMVYKAVRELAPGMALRIEHSVSRGLYCTLRPRRAAADAVGASSGDTGAEEVCEPDPGLIRDIRVRVKEIAARRIPFERKERLTADVTALFREQGLDDKVALLETVDQIYTTYYLLDDTADCYYGPLAPDTGHIRVFDLRTYKQGFLLLGPDTVDPAVPATPVRQSKMFDAFLDIERFNRVVGVSCVAELNRAVEAGCTSPLINVAEAMHDKILGRISDEIARRRREGCAGIIMMAGPSSSGKTTTGKRLSIQLMTNLIKPKMISLDDYFVDRVRTPLDENGEYDYESLYALDLDLFNSDLRRLLRGEEINLPTYSFELGARILKPRPLRLYRNDVLVIEGIHGLNPELTAGISPDDIFKVYVSALTTLNIDDHNWISTTDNRLLRRIVRDHKYRHISPAETIRRWPSVRRGEEKWIFPFQENADATFNSSLIFEIGVMKAYAEPLLRNVSHSDSAYVVAHRLVRFLEYFRTVPADQIPSTSLLREFLGGSSFHY